VLRSEVQRQLSTATSEAALWRQKYESGEGNIRPEEVEDLKKKFALRIQESDAQLEASVGKAAALERARVKLQLDIEALLVEVEKVGFYGMCALKIHDFNYNYMPFKISAVFKGAI